MRVRIILGLLFLTWTGAALAAEKTTAKETAPQAVATAGELTLDKILSSAEEVNPGIKFSQAMEKKAEASASVVSSFDYPNLDLSASDSIGLSTPYYPTPFAYDGLLNSSYRRWAGADLVIRWNILDVSRWHDLDQHHEKIHSAEENIRVKRLEIYQQALQLYLQASLLRGQREVWGDIADKSKEILKVASGFVHTGEYNEDKMLVIKIEKEEAETERDSFEEKYRKTLRKLALLTGLDDKGMECPLPSALDEGILRVIQEGSSSPYLTFAQSEIKAARATYDKSSAERLPKLFVMGSVGALEGLPLAPQDDYSAWVGINLPLFDGYRIGSEEKERKAEINEKEERLKDAQLDVDELNTQYDEKINVAHIRIPLLEQESKDANRSFVVARQRFLSYRETVVIVRESLRDLSFIETQVNDSKIELLTALGLKSFLNGGTVPK